MFDKFNDDYQPAKDIDKNGNEWFYLEIDKHILFNRRTQLQMTQQQVADQAHILLRQYQRFEKGERSMAQASLRIGLAICDVLRLDPHRFCIDMSSPRETKGAEANVD